MASKLKRKSTSAQSRRQKTSASLNLFVLTTRDCEQLAQSKIYKHITCSHQPSLHYHVLQGQYRTGNEDIGLPGARVVISEAVAMTTHSQ